MEKVTGFVDHIVFQNKENGYTVMILSAEGEEITCVGMCKGLSQGENISAEGEYIEHPVYGHQYMSAVYDPAQSAKSTYSGYVKTGTLDQLRTFLIPVYSNMPSFVTTSVKFNDAVSEIGFDATTNVRATASRAGKVAFKISH